MRTIKFRGQRIDNGKWVYGYYTTARLPIFGTMGHFINKDGFHAIEILPNTVGQYTGLKDKNGNEIYEGDIIECISSSGKPIRHFIKFCDGRGYYAQYDNNTWTGELNECGPIYQHYIDECGKYVIGNIYDDKDLLDFNEN